MTAPTQEEQAQLVDLIDGLDGVKGSDVTKVERPLFDSIMQQTPEKKAEAIRLLMQLNACNDEYQIACQKYNLLEGTNPDEITRANALDKLKGLERKKLRMMRFAQVKEGKLGATDDNAKEDQKKIVEKVESFEKLRASDVLFLKKKWADLTKLLLVPANDSFWAVSRDTLKERDDFTVNFGGNPSLNQIIGAGDILPPTVSHVRINGVEGERKNSPRPGYYTQEGQYLPVYDGDKIEVVKIGEVLPEFLAESTAAEDAWLREQRINDMIDSEGKALTDAPEDKQLEAEAQEEIKQRKELRETIGRMRYGDKFGYGTNLPVSDTVKVLKDLNLAETHALLEKIFGEGPGTELLKNIDGGNRVAIHRMIALASHEGGFVFGRQNPDPASGYNYGTFQIGWARSTPESSFRKYEECMYAGIKLARSKGIQVDHEKLIADPAQRDLIAHLGYIEWQRGGSQTFARLANPNLGREEVSYLMHHDIQWGISAIGHSVNSQIATTKVDLAKIRAA